MKTTLTYVICFALLSIIPLAGISQKGPNINPSYFEKSLVKYILDQKDCTGIRVYPAMDTKAGVLSMMMIGTTSNGEEIYNGLKSKSKYQLYQLDGNTPTSEPLNKSNAGKACGAYAASNPKYVVNFKEADINKLWSENGSEGMKLKTAYENSLNNFDAFASKNSGGTFPDMGAPVQGDPCPTFCGDMNNYLCQ